MTTDRAEIWQAFAEDEGDAKNELMLMVRDFVKAVIANDDERLGVLAREGAALLLALRAEAIDGLAEITTLRDPDWLDKLRHEGGNDESERER